MDTLGKLFETLKGHEEIYTKLVKLQGKMDLLISYVSYSTFKCTFTKNMWNMEENLLVLFLIPFFKET